MGAYSRNKGNAAERDLAVFLRAWWPTTCRAVRTGSSVAPDPGDIANGPPGVIWSCKSVAADAASKPSVRAAWWAELDAMLEDDPAALGVIVEKRPGSADVSTWHANLRLGDLVALHSGGALPSLGDRAPARVSVGTLTELLIARGFARQIASADFRAR